MSERIDPSLTLATLGAALDMVASRLTSDARPPAAVIEEFTATLDRAHHVLALALSGVESQEGDVRLATMRAAVEVKRKLQVVARLAAGSAWYAALAKELDGDARMRNGAIYGRKGAGTALPLTPPFERRA